MRSQVIGAGVQALVIGRPGSIGRKARLFALAAGLALFSQAPVAATTTISLTALTYGYFDPTESNNFQLSPFHSGTAVANFAQVGRATDSSPFSGDYAATIEFLIPTLPSDAILTGLSLTVTPQFGSPISDVQLRSYFAANTAPDPTRIFAGSNLTNYLNLNPNVVTTDLLGGPTVNYLEDNPGLYLGFSFRETNPLAPRFCPATCQPKTIGSTGDPGFYTLPVLTVSYDIPTPPSSDVPEPASWAMMIAGFGTIGATMRRRKIARAPA
jgi:hypothetical protein